MTSQEIAAWRITLSPGYRFEATQALRQVFQRAVAWGMLDVNPAKVGVDNPVRRRKEQHPFESWAELEALAAAIGPRYGPMILFAVATGLRPAEWIALEKRDVDHEERVVFVRRSYTRGELKIPKTEASTRAVPLQARALDALDRIVTSNGSPLLFPGERGGYLDIHHFRPFQWRPAQKAAGIKPARRVYDLRHTFATFALRAGVSTFDLSRYMGASLTMIDRHYGHLARDGREHAIKLLDALNAPWTLVDARWTPRQPAGVTPANESALSWAPSGRMFVYVKASAKFAFGVATSTGRPLRSFGRLGSGPAFWSPRGDRIAYVAAPRRGARQQLFTVRPSGKRNTQLTHDAPVAPDDPVARVAWVSQGPQKGRRLFYSRALCDTTP